MQNMHNQDIPFLIWAEKKEISQRISEILDRKANTYTENGSSAAVADFLEKINYFTCNVFHMQADDPLIHDLIQLSLKRRPLSPVILFTFEKYTPESYHNFIRGGVTDVLYFDGKMEEESLRENLVKTLNHRWRIFRYLERERSKIYKATVVTAYHEINQPLTVILNSIGLFNIELKNKRINYEKIVKFLKFILKSTKRIQEILNLLKKIEQPHLKEYTKGVPMISLEQSKKKPQRPAYDEETLPTAQPKPSVKD